MKKLTLAVGAVSLSVLTMLSVPAQAARNAEAIYKQCGIGGIIFGGSSPILAVISNVTWDLGTTAALSDSLSPETCNKGAGAVAGLVSQTFDNLEQDVAAGKGEHLTALNTLMACPVASKNMRQDYANFTTTAAYSLADKSQNAAALYNIVYNNMQSAGCAM